MLGRSVEDVEPGDGEVRPSLRWVQPASDIALSKKALTSKVAKTIPGNRLMLCQSMQIDSPYAHTRSRNTAVCTVEIANLACYIVQSRCYITNGIIFR